MILLHITPDMVPAFLAALGSLPLVAIVVASWVGIFR